VRITNCFHDYDYDYAQLLYKCNVPVMPRYAEELVPPSADDHGYVETKYK